MTEFALRAAILEARAIRHERDAARKAKALDMLARGETIAAAARAVRADERTVKRWKEEACKIP